MGKAKKDKMEADVQRLIAELDSFGPNCTSSWPGEGVAPLLNERYWMRTESPSVVREAGKRLLGNYEPCAQRRTARCCQCNQMVEELFTSWQSVKNANHSFSAWRCTVCEAQNEKEWEDFLAEEAQQDGLRALPYNEYLQTEHWAQKRKKALNYARHRCQLCNNNGELHVHHRTYENLGAEYPSDLIVLCRSCHERHHAVTP